MKRTIHIRSKRINGLLDRLLSYDAMCVACGRTYRSRPFHREHPCNAY